MNTLLAWAAILFFLVPMGTVASILQYRAQEAEALRAREEAQQ